jgi:hypothetical protein
MRAFFAGFNFARFIILACLVGAFPLGYSGWKRYEHNQMLSAALQPGGEVERLVRQIQSNSHLYTSLKLEQRDESLFGGEQSDVHGYIRRHAFADNIEIGQVSITPRPVPFRTFIDHTHLITPDDPKRDFSRTQLANFLYRLESESSRVKVTDIDIRNSSDRRLADEEVPPDRWTFKATITTREKVE